MMPEKSQKIEQNELEHVVSFLRAAQNTFLHFRQYPGPNSTIEISTLSHSDDDRPDPLRIPEVLIVISVLLLWCGSIFIFIRHSELLRIRQRDIPYRSSLNPTMSLNHIAVSTRTSEMTIPAKSRLSSNSGVTPPIIRHIFPLHKHGETIERISLAISPALQKRRHTHSFDCNTLAFPKYSPKNNGKEHFLHPKRISSDVKHDVLNLQSQKVNSFTQKSVENLSMIKYSTCYSEDEVLEHQSNDDIDQSTDKKRSVQESPV